MPIIVQKQIFLMSLYFLVNLPNCPSIAHFYLRKLEVCTILSENHQEGEQIMLLSRKSAQLTVYRTFLFKEMVRLHHFIGKSPRGRANNVHRY